jgi:hypothetical protein
MIRPVHKATPEETAVRIEIPADNGGILLAHCIVVHDGTEVLDVRPPPDWRALANAAGIPYPAQCFEGYIETLARFAFARGGR